MTVLLYSLSVWLLASAGRQAVSAIDQVLHRVELTHRRRRWSDPGPDDDEGGAE